MPGAFQLGGVGVAALPGSLGVAYRAWLLPAVDVSWEQPSHDTQWVLPGVAVRWVQAPRATGWLVPLYDKRVTPKV